jgi:hypothetical protein
VAEPSADNDASAAYMQHAQAQSTNATIEQFRLRMQQRTPPPGEQPQQPAPQPDRAPTRITVSPGILQRIGEGAGAVASDVGTGFMEAPSAIGKGIYGAAHNTLTGTARALDSVGEWLNSQVDLRADVPTTGYDALDKIIANPVKALGEALPDKPEKPKSVTGNVLYEGARFLTGFLPTLRVMKAAGMGGTSGSVVAGALSEFAAQDPGEKNISTLIQAVPALKNPVTEYLATDPDAPEAMNRLRHAVEGLGFGVLTEGIVRGIRTLAHTRKVGPEIVAQQQRAGEATRQAEQFLGDPSAPLISTTSPVNVKLSTATAQTETGVPEQVAAKGLAVQAARGRAATEAAGEPQVYVNFSRISSPDDVQTVIRDMANAFKGEIDEARRGVQSNEETARLADELAMTPEDLLARRKGQPFNAEESLAARRLLAGSAEKLLESAKRAADPNAGPADLYNFRRMMAIHQAVQSEVIAARTETARALQAWSIPAGGGAERVRAIENLLEGAGGSDVSAELARRVATLADQGVPPGALADVVRRGWTATTMDAVKEAYVLGLLWNPTTHLVNAGSNMIVAFQSVYERAVAAKIGDTLGSAADGVANGEAIAMAYGMISSMGDAFRLAGRAIRTGETGAGVGKIDLPRERAISSTAVSRELGHGAADAAAFTESGMGRAIDFIGAVNNVPGRVLGAGDEFFRTITYRAEVHAQSLRQATQEGLSGPDLYRRMAELANNPPEHIRLAAADAALYNTFQQRPGEWAQSLLNMRNAGTLNPTFLVLPFIKTPANILRYTFERTPLAPLVSQWRDDIAAGGARRDLALARMATGTAILSVAMDYASSGLITGPGPSNPAKREALMRQGWQPNSVFIDGKYYSFNRADPLGMLLGFAGGVAERVKATEQSPDDFDEWEEILASGIGAISSSVVDKTYFQGVTNVLDIIKGTQRGEGGLEKYIDRQTGSLMPLSSAFGAMKRFADPVSREINSPWDAIQAKIVGLSEKLPPARDLWGEERKPAEVYGRVYDLFSPVAVSQQKDSPIDAELERLNVGVTRIPKRTVFQGAEVDFRDYPQVYDEYVRLAGNELKHPAWNLGLKDYLNAVVSGKHAMSQVYQIYSDGPEGGKSSFIRNAISEYRKLAQDQIMSDDRWSEFTAKIRDRQARKQELKAPMGFGGSVRLP